MTTDQPASTEDIAPATTPRRAKVGRPARAHGSEITGLRSVNIVHNEPPSNEIARAVLDYILSGQVGPGEKLPSERQLSESFGVGRSVIREALKSLGLLGLIEFRHGGGTYFRGANSDLLPRVIEWGLLLGERHTIDLVEARQHIEKVTAGLAASRRSEQDLANIENKFAAMQAVTSSDEWVNADVDFHLAIADASGNTVLANMLKSISSLLRVWIHRVMDEESSFERAIREHEPVLAAIRNRDSTAAGAAMESHMQKAGARLIATLEDHQD
ncbi:FadR/GntR family transcriptional regulator [Rathayibacter sp. VKM Ac-2801]|uniref:FadR/GntR family transcriptional regulator n=1 Tax=Rathayibacter sp. VKM Ac-2801 TaxID=2609255 RepID=UPI001ABE16BA|nr:FadR/GntR family transcriptional regulator [Rathayibacter sp. VKM Ac-2801]